MLVKALFHCERLKTARFMSFREANGILEHVAVIIGERSKWPDPIPVRIHSACLTGDLFGSLRCDCGEQLQGSLRVFSDTRRWSSLVPGSGRSRHWPWKQTARLCSPTRRLGHG